MNGLWAMPGTMDANARLLPFFLVIFVVAPIMSYCKATATGLDTGVYMLTARYSQMSLAPRT